MNKEQLKKSEGTFVYLDPPPIKLQGLCFGEYVAMWRIENVYLATNRIELANPYFDYRKELPLNIVRNIDEDYKSFKFPYQIKGILNLYAQLHLVGYHVIVMSNKAKWGQWHHQNYRLGRRIVPYHVPTYMEIKFLRTYYNQYKWGQNNYET